MFGSWPPCVLFLKSGEISLSGLLLIVPPAETQTILAACLWILSRHSLSAVVLGTSRGSTIQMRSHLMYVPFPEDVTVTEMEGCANDMTFVYFLSGTCSTASTRTRQQCWKRHSSSRPTFMSDSPIGRWTRRRPVSPVSPVLRSVTAGCAAGPNMWTSSKRTTSSFPSTSRPTVLSASSASQVGDRQNFGKGSCWNIFTGGYQNSERELNVRQERSRWEWRIIGLTEIDIVFWQDGGTMVEY